MIEILNNSPSQKYKFNKIPKYLSCVIFAHENFNSIQLHVMLVYFKLNCWLVAALPSVDLFLAALCMCIESSTGLFDKIVRGGMKSCLADTAAS